MEKHNEARPLVVKDLVALESRLDRRFGAVDQRFAAVDQRFVVVDQRFDAVDRKFDAVDQRFDAVDRKFDAVDRKFDAVNQRFDAVDRRVDGVDRKVDELKSQSQTQFEALRDDIRLLAGHMVRVEGKLDRHVEQSAVEHAQIRAEIVAGDAALDRRITRLEQRMDERAG